ncbi:MAG TPA: iron ABC transporter substrate-binding protein [Stellaceae bacterium]|jgi:iron complex transport system substrate-binding protein|nr:iron ABC transporter substrate-binding protein [Stellaceae bacterium]
MNRLAGFCFFLLLLAPAIAGAKSFTDSGGRTVQLPDQATHVWPAGPPSEALIYILAPEKLVGWTHRVSPESAAFMPKEYGALPVVGRLTGRGNTANLEAVIAAKPDLILDVGTIGPTYVSLADRVQDQTHIPYVLIGSSLADTPKLLRAAGAVLSVPDRAETLARYAEDEIAGIQKKIAAVPANARPKAYMARGPRGLETDVTGSINGEALAFLGAQNVVPAGTSTGNLADVSMEQMLTWQPDIIVTIDKNFFASVFNDPQWQGVKAVREKHVYLEPLNPFGWVDEPPGANRLIGLRWLAHLLYPQLFTGDIRAETKRFYELFYHQAPTDAQLDQLLGTTK